MGRGSSGQASRADEGGRAGEQAGRLPEAGRVQGEPQSLPGWVTGLGDWASLLWVGAVAWAFALAGGFKSRRGAYVPLAVRRGSASGCDALETGNLCPLPCGGRWPGAGGTEETGVRRVTRGLPQVLDTYMFHSFLKARLSRRMDAFAQMELSTQSEEDRCAAGCGRLWAPGLARCRVVAQINGRSAAGPTCRTA